MDEIIVFDNYFFKYIYSTKQTLSNIDLRVMRGEISLIVGPSGCGKSTLLRSINGLIPHMYPGVRTGSVTVDGHEVANTSVSELAKKVGFVFQNPENQIFMFSVERDVAFGLENLGLPREEVRERVDWALNLLGISHLAQRAPHELSDGQKQRVALAGVLATKPGILILDEPTSLLDPHTALELIDLVKQLHDSLNITILVVEHRIDLVAKIATRVIVMNEGRIILDGPAKKILGIKEASLLGVGIPTITRLHNLLVESGVSLDETSVSAKELAEKLNVIMHD